MDAEREALQCTAYPEVQSFCQKHGLTFEAVDLRWGVPDTQAADHLTTELCLEELDRCQRTSVGPAFVALLGDQYGPCLVPQRIEEKEWEALRAQLTSRPRDLELVARHFRRDDNTIPPTYILQSSGSVEAPGPEEATLTSVLQGGAQEAWRLGVISQEQWKCYHRSVIEWEIEQGLLSSARGDQGATVFLRDVQDLSKHILDDCSLKMVDRLADGCLDTDAQSLLSSLKGRILDAQPGALKSHHLPWSRDLVNPKNKAHARYLKELSEQFVARTNHQVLEQLRELESGRQELDWLYQEIRHHLWRGTESTRIFCGQRELLAKLGQRLRQDDSWPHTPLVLFGPPGIGKTSLTCKLAEQVPGLLGHKTVTVLRLLGTSTMSLDARSLLKSLSFQLCLAYGLPLPPTQVLEVHARVGHFFHTLLHTVSRRNFESLVLLLDSVDDLDSTRHSQRISWLPLKCPPRVHIILSACSGQQWLHTLRQTLKDPGAYWEVKALSGCQGQEFIQLLLNAERRTLSPGQRDILWASLPECGHPGRLRLAFEEARKWASFTVPVPLATTAEEATHQLCMRLEETHGQLLVAHVLGYLVSSRSGLSEAELKDVLSLDDEVLQAVYQDWTPPSKELLRFPPLLWVRLRRDLGHCLTRRPVDGCTLLAIAHRQLSKVIQVRYLSGPERSKRHAVLAEFFSGAWSQGTKKLITLPHLGKPINLDRKVAPQPLWFSGTVANRRKLTELPFHLLHAGRMEELKQEVLGNMSWISCRGISGGIEDLLEDFDMCAPHMDSPEVGLVREALQLCRPAVELRGMENSVLYTELLARLLFFATSYPAMIGQLCQQAQSWFRACPHPMLVPLAGFLQPPGGRLRATLTGCHKGVTAIAWSLEEKLLVVGTQDGAMVVWDVEEQQVAHVLTGHTAEVRCIRVFALGTLAISASKDRTLRLWSLLSGQEKLTILDRGSPTSTEPQSWELHVDEMNKVIYLTSSAKISMWNLETAKLVFCIPGDASDPWACMAVLAAQGVLLAVSKGGQVSVWDSAMGKLQEKYQLPSIKEETPTCAVSIQTRAKLVTGFSSGSIFLVSSGEDRLLEKLPEAVGFLVVSEDDSVLAAGFGRSVRIFLADSQGFHRFMAMDLEHEDVVETAVMGPENNMIITGSRDALIQVWSLSEQGTLLDVLEGVGAPASLLVRGGTLVVSASSKSSSLKVWDLRSTQKPRPPAPFLDRTGLAAVSHHGSYIYFPKVGDKNKVTIWDLAEGEEQDFLDTSNEVRCLEVAEQAKLLFTGLVSGIVLVFPLSSRQDVLCIPPPEARKAVNCMSLSKSEDRLAIAYDNIVLVVDISPGDPCPTIEGPTYTFYTQLPETIASVAMLADYRVLYGMTDGGLFLYNCASSKVFPLEAHGSRVSCMAVSHGEQLAVSGAEDALLCLWDLQACRGMFEMSYESSYCRGARCACFSKDDKYVFAGMKDRSIIAWSALDGTLLAVQFVHAVVSRIIPTSNGFMAPTSHGYLIREHFQCPSARASQQDPLKNFKRAVWLVKTRQRKEQLTSAEASEDTGGWSPRKRDLGSSGGGADAALTSNMAHAGGGGSAGRGFGGSRWGRSGSGGHEKLPVHVEDALTYLDQVKIRFGSDPATYNGFLEIMKEFKSQSIDTPGVIRRVSQLFHEHPDLIVGFNAFLPLGYRIDIPKNGKLNIQSPLNSQENSHSHGDCGEDFKQMSYKEDRGQVPLESDSVEFNNAISYVNKIKTRFLDHPEIYRSFLEILHTYQKEQLHTKGRPFRGMSEEEVFTEVANLFRGQEDLLSEFGQFLPEAKRSLFTGNGPCEMNSAQKNEEKSLEHSKKRSRPSLLRPVSAPAKKKMKLRGTKDLSIAAVGKYGTLQEFSFFDKVRRVLKSQEVYENFLRCIALFNQELVSGSELLQLVSPFLGKFPELFAQFKSFLGVKELSFAPPMSDRSGDGISREIDYASCKRIGSSYRALPKTYQQPKCSGRTAICKEVLNDTWVSFPSWSEDSTFVSSKKTPYEEQLHRCEDERFELDVVLETNLATIRVLESVQKKLSRMAPEDQEKLRLDDCLGGTSEVIQRRAIHRIYGDKAPEVIESLKRNPVTAVPVVLKRLKAKEEEWREAQQGFNKIWREQYEKAYLKSLDHQAVNFKQNDTKALRSKSLLNEIESVYDEHQEQHSEGRSAPSSEPHLIFVYEDRQILEDAAALISYYVKRQPAIQKEDQGTIRQLLHRFLPSLFFSQQRPGASDDSADERERDGEPERRRPADEKPPVDLPPEPPKALDDVYSLFFANNNWYFFLRLHQTLCARLLKIYRQAQKQLLEHRREQEREQLLCEGRREKAADPAMELRLKQPSEVELEEYYPAFLDMVRSLLEGSIDPTQYEDTLREMFTIHAYIGFTMDKLVQNIARQLHHLVSDDVCLKVVELYLNEQQRGAAGGNLSSRCVRAARETSYQWKAERCMADENCFKVMFLQRRGQVIMTIELLDTEEAQAEDPVEVQHLARYVEQYVGTEGASNSPTNGFLLKPVFLQRNLKKFRRWQCEQVRSLRGEAKSSWKRLMGVESACDVDCRFRLGTHKMVFIVNSEDYMYRRGTLCRAKQLQPLVLLRHHRHFEEWHGRWLEDNVTVAAAGLVQDWLMGEEEEDMVPCKTLCETAHVHGLPVTRYRVQYSRRPASP